MGKIMAETVFATLAVWGLYCLLRLVESLFRPSRQVVPAVIIRKKEELDVLDMYIDEAKRRQRTRGCMPPVLIDTRLLETLPGGQLSEETQALLQHKGSEWYAVELKDT